MLFSYKVVDKDGRQKTGQIDSHSKEVAINSLQSRGYIIVSIKSEDEKSIFEKNISFGGVSNKEIVILSQQLSILFTAQVSALKIFRMISGESKNPILKNALTEIASDIADGSSLTGAMAKHPKVFSSFYVNMVAAGEEAGKLSQTFTFLADYLERSYAITSKAKSALIYPSFVLGVFVIVMYMMLTMVIPKIAGMLDKNGQELPVPTKIVIWASDFLVNYGLFFIIALIFGGYFLWKYINTESGKLSFDSWKIKIPLFGKLFRQLYAARVAGNIDMLLRSGVSMVKTLENTAEVVDNKYYEDILKKITKDVRGGLSLSKAFEKYPEDFPNLLIQMIKVGEESGRIADILSTMAKFYEKEVITTVGVLVSLIEPIMIVGLGGGVGLLIAAIIIPIYSVTDSI